jgi:hypothetical protein
MRLISLVFVSLALVGCGSVTLESDAHDADAPAAPSQKGNGGAHDAAAAMTAPAPPASAPAAPASAPAPPASCGKMCQSGNGDSSGMGKHGGQTCDKSPCMSDDPG